MISRKDPKAAKTSEDLRSMYNLPWAAPKGPLFQGRVPEKA